MMGVKEGGGSVRELASLLLGVCVALFILVASSSPKKVDYGDAANFGAATTTMMASYDGHSIHCHALDDANNCIKGVNARGANSSILWLGNSQIHAVNQAIGNDQTAVPTLFESMKAKGLDLVVFSQPNSNLQEHWILFEYLSTKLPVKKLILPVVFDDTREEGLRKEVADALGDEGVRKKVLTYDLGVKLLNSKELSKNSQSTNAQSANSQSTNAQSANSQISNIRYKSNATAQTYDSWLENFSVLWLKYSSEVISCLNNFGNLYVNVNKPMIGEGIELDINAFLERHSDLWRMRPDLRAQVIYGYLYTWRNLAFGITPNSKRKVIRGRYKDNMEALRITLESALRNNIETYVYIAPIRNDVPIPYDDIEYANFKTEVENIARTYHSNFINYEDLIPANYWGEKGSTGKGSLEIDFMHFQAKGHQMLAKKLAELVK
jgi:hypothetical protein